MGLPWASIADVADGPIRMAWRDRPGILDQPHKQDQPTRTRQTSTTRGTRAIDSRTVKERGHPAAVGREGGGTDCGVFGTGAQSSVES